MAPLTRRLLFSFFFVSGFCSLLYQTVWTRMAFASFGIITPVLSVVLSIFMLGLSVGAWAGGRLIGPLQKRTGLSPIFFYALTELLIGLGAFAVPELFHLDEKILLSAGEMDSVRYLLFSAAALGLSIFPWCLCMGATFPFMMAFVRRQSAQSEDSFSFLYLANVLGAMSGTGVTAVVLVETLGFRHTLFVAAFANFLVALVSCSMVWKRRRAAESSPAGLEIASSPPKREVPSVSRRRLIKWILFSTGFCAMAMEVIWARSFTPVVETQVYAFAMILFAYLGATFLGSTFYRRDLRRNRVRSIVELSAVLAVAAFLPIVLNDMRFLASHPYVAKYAVRSFILMLSICPLCAALGYLTPSLIDEDALGDPAEAGRAYAVNVLGCIVGPLFASYVLLPWIGERYGLVLLGLPFVLFYFFAAKSSPTRYRIGIGLAATVLLLWSIFFSVDFAGFMSGKTRVEIRRDYAASVVAAGEGRNKHLLVNGVGMTGLIPATKFMVHLPLMLHRGKAESALIICFGMGTTFRSALSWDIETTAVELVPSVKDSFEFYHADAAQVRNNPKGHIIIDDGRRYLYRTREKFDIVVIDPPPPPEAAGSSLLYSDEFYEVAKRHLKPYGILQAWVPKAETATKQAILRSARDSFPYLRCFWSPGDVGIHILASMEPIKVSSPATVAYAMPRDAADDLLEWSPTSSLVAYLRVLLAKPFWPEEMLNSDPNIRVTDDRPFNEYYLLRRSGL